MTRRKRTGTRTSAFGSPGRASHDASDFYNSRLYRDQPLPEPDQYLETPLPEASRNALVSKVVRDHVRTARSQRPPYGDLAALQRKQGV